MEEKSFKFWYYWLVVATVLNFVIALVIAFAPDSPFFSMHTDAIATAWFPEGWTEGAEQVRQFFFGIIGGTLAGYFILQGVIVWVPFYRREQWAWHAIFWAMVVWFLIDSSLSVVHGAFFNVWMINVWPLILVLLPLVMTRRYFFRETADQDSSRISSIL